MALKTLSLVCLLAAVAGGAENKGGENRGAEAGGAPALQVIHGVNAEIYFSPNGGATEAIVHELAEARKEVRIQAYLFNSEPIAQALEQAKRRGVDVSVLLDKSQREDPKTIAGVVSHAGIPVEIDEKPSTAHSKVMIIDKAIVITGSFNFTKASEIKNVENLLIIHSPELALSYLANWNKRHAESVPYVAK